MFLCFLAGMSELVLLPSFYSKYEAAARLTWVYPKGKTNASMLAKSNFIDEMVQKLKHL